MLLSDDPTQSTMQTPVASADHVESGSRRSLPKQLQHLALVLWVSFTLPVIGSTFYLFNNPSSSTTPTRQTYRLITALVAEVTSLLVLWYVVDKQGKTKTDIGLNFHFLDIFRGLGLFVVAVVASYIAYIPFQYIYRAYSGNFAAVKSLHSMFGFGISFLSVSFICLNPFFEEIIVRGYAMTEVISVGGSPALAIVISVAIQISYHLYQGLARVLLLAVVFSIYAIYFA